MSGNRDEVQRASLYSEAELIHSMLEVANLILVVGGDVTAMMCGKSFAVRSVSFLCALIRNLSPRE